MVTGLWFGFRVPQSLNLVDRTRRSFLGLVRGLQFEKRLGVGPPGALLAPDVVIEAVDHFRGLEGSRIEEEREMPIRSTRTFSTAKAPPLRCTLASCITYRFLSSHEVSPVQLSSAIRAYARIARSHGTIAALRGLYFDQGSARLRGVIRPLLYLCSCTRC
jgi:hypothetical protein